MRGRREGERGRKVGKRGGAEADVKGVSEGEKWRSKSSVDCLR